MNTKWMITAAVAMSTLGVSAAAHAEGEDEPVESRSRKTAAIKDAIELTIGNGYAQGFGNVGSDRPSLTDLGTAGYDIQGGAGYRLNPHLTLGAYGSWGVYGRGDQADPTGHIYSSSAGLQAEWHFRPEGHELDPWVSLGAGWRGYWMTADRGTTAMHGLQLAKLQVGLDYRVHQQVAISPVIGADLTTFLTQSTPQDDAWRNVSSPEVNTFLFIGFQGRFDIPIARQDDAARVGSR